MIIEPQMEISTRFGVLPFSAVKQNMLVTGTVPDRLIHIGGKLYGFSCCLVLKGEDKLTWWHAERPRVESPRTAKISETIYKAIQNSIEKDFNKFALTAKGRVWLRSVDIWWAAQLRLGILDEIKKTFADLQILKDKLETLINHL